MLDPNVTLERTASPKEGTILNHYKAFFTECQLWVKSHPFVCLFLAVIIPGSFMPGLRFDDTLEKEHCVLQADAFLKGRADVKADTHLNDLVNHNGKTYIVNPPFPSLLMTPIVFLLGVDQAKGIYLTAILTLANVFQIWKMARRLGCHNKAVSFILAFLLGTGYWFCFTQSDGMWFVAHIVSFTFLLAAVNESIGRRRGWFTGLFLGASFLSRQATIYAGIFLACALCMAQCGWYKKLQKLSGFGIVFGAAVGVYLWFNWVRFGDPFDTGYSYLVQPHFLDARQENLGMFHWSYIPSNAIQMLFSGLQIDLLGPDLMAGWKMSLMGTSVTFASPFVFFAIFSGLSRGWRIAAWMAVGLTSLHILSYHANGWVQINCYRYTLDFLPILLPLCLTGISPDRALAWKWAAAYAVGLNALALVLLPLGNILYLELC